MAGGGWNNMLLTQEGRDQLRPRLRLVLWLSGASAAMGFLAARVPRYLDGTFGERSIDDIFLLLLICFVWINNYWVVLRVADKLSERGDAKL